MDDYTDIVEKLEAEVERLRQLNATYDGIIQEKDAVFKKLWERLGRLGAALEKIKTEADKYRFDTGGIARGGLQIVYGLAEEALAPQAPDTGGSEGK